MKKFIINLSCLALGIGLELLTLKKNREYAGIIKNQQHTINGLQREVKNLAYHLGKHRKYN